MDVTSNLILGVGLGLENNLYKHKTKGKYIHMYIYIHTYLLSCCVSVSLRMLCVSSRGETKSHCTDCRLTHGKGLIEVLMVTSNGTETAVS